jgi:hypothetical protein
MSIRTTLLGKATATEKVQPSAPPSLERLEPRLLLDANYADPESSLSLDTAFVLPALVVDLDREGQQVPADATTQEGQLVSYNAASLADSSPAPDQRDADLASPGMRPDALVAPRETVAQIVASPPVGEGPYGATLSDTSEFMIGDVWVNLVLLESDGSIDPSTENWTTTEINNVKAEVQEGLAWWEDTLHSAMTPTPLNDLEFHIDYTYADSPIPTGYEPISRSAGGTVDEGRWIDDVLDYIGYNSPAPYFADVRQWDHHQRIAHNVDWAYTIFVVDSSADADGAFANGYFAYAYIGGPFLVMTYTNGGWGIDKMGQVLAHETGHIFYALDEYPGAGSYTDHSGYYNTQNLNASDGNPDPGSRVASIMADVALQNAAYANRTSSPTSLEMVGWKDSDSDGIFDVLDVPLTLEGTGDYDAATRQYAFSGTSRVQTLPNLNPRGPGHDITINTVDLLQYRIDSGPWVDGSHYEGYDGNVSQNVTAAGGSMIRLRTICEETGLSSSTITLGPALTWDIDNNGSYDALTDGLLTMRYLFGFRGDILIADAAAPDAQRSKATDIEAYLAFAGSAAMLDIDGNGVQDALTDGLLIVRYLFWFRGDTLIDSAVAPDTTRTTAEEIQAFITSFTPLPAAAPHASVEPEVFPVLLETDISSMGRIDKMSGADRNHQATPRKAEGRPITHRLATDTPLRCGKKDLDRVGREHPPLALSETAISSSGGAKSGAPDAPNPVRDPDLARIVGCWPRLPEHIKAAIRALVQADSGGRD